MPKSKARQHVREGQSATRRTGLNPAVLKKKSNPVRREAARDTSPDLGQKVSASRSRVAKEATRPLAWR